MNRKSVWAEKGILLGILSLLLIANTIFFFTYRVQYVERLRALDETLAQREKTLKDAHTARLAAEHQHAAYRKIQTDLDEVYNKRWSTRAARFTVLISEVKKLAQASNFAPKVYNFTLADAGSGSSQGQGRTQPLRGSNGRKNALHASEVGIMFNATGTYDQVRRLVNLLELSDQFVIINQLSITSSDLGLVTVSLNLKTLFRETAEEMQAKSL